MHLDEPQDLRAVISMCQLSVNVDHVATIREARRSIQPDPIHVAVLAELGGANGITVHLRGDQRHIKLRDVRILKDVVRTRLTLEMAATEEMVVFASGIVPYMVTLVPENPGEVSTEGGLDLVSRGNELSKSIAPLFGSGIVLCAFVDPDIDQIHAASQMGLDAVEFCTTRYSECLDKELRSEELETLKGASRLASKKGLLVHAGHGLDYDNVSSLAAIPEMSELSIGHSIVARAVMMGMERAVGEMIELIWRARAPRRRDFVVV